MTDSLILENYHDRADRFNRGIDTGHYADIIPFGYVLL